MCGNKFLFDLTLLGTARQGPGMGRDLGWAVPWEGARAYGGRGMGGYRNLGGYKSLEEGRGLGVGGDSLTWA